jgi:hypothetical protein
MRKTGILALLVMCVPMTFGLTGLCPFFDVPAGPTTLLSKTYQIRPGQGEFVNAAFATTAANRTVAITMAGPTTTDPNFVVTDANGVVVLTADAAVNGSEATSFVAAAIQTYTLTLTEANGAGGSFAVEVTQAAQ